jgi:hypothetical protein
VPLNRFLLSASLFPYGKWLVFYLYIGSIIIGRDDLYIRIMIIAPTTIAIAKIPNITAFSFLSVLFVLFSLFRI